MSHNAGRRIRRVTTFLSVALTGLAYLPAAASKTQTYDYFVDVQTGKPFSLLYESGPVRYVILFPGHNASDEFLYGNSFVAFLSVSSKQSYSVRDLWLSIARDGQEIIPLRITYLDDKLKWKQDTRIMSQPTPPRELDFDFATEVLIGFIFEPSQFDDLAIVDLDVKFLLTVGEVTSHVHRHFELRRTGMSEVLRSDPRFIERKPGESVLVGPWWLGAGTADLSAEYDAAMSAPKSDAAAATRLTGTGYLPRLRFDRIHFEGFFMHYDRERK